MKQFLYTMIAIVFSFQTNTAFAQSRQDMRNEIREAKRAALQQQRIINPENLPNTDKLPTLDETIEQSVEAIQNKSDASNNNPELDKMIAELTKQAELANSNYYFDVLRRELTNDRMQSGAKQQERSKAANFVIHLSQTKLIFHAIGGGLILQDLAKSYSGDPLEMVKHLEQTFDPIAWLSFSAFMAANNIYMDFKNKNIPIELRAQAMRTLMYKGMSIGSMASTITSDVANLFKGCVKHWIRIPPTTQSARQKEVRIENEAYAKTYKQGEEQCNVALEQWTTKAVFQRYSASIVTLMMGQIVSDAIQHSVEKSLGNKFTRSALNKTESILSKYILRAPVGTLAATITPGGWAIKSINFLTTVAQYYAFLGPGDHYIRNYTERLIGNSTKTFTTWLDMGDLNKSLGYLNLYSWNLEQASKLASTPKIGEHLSKIPSQLEEFHKIMTDWRIHLNSKNEQKIQLWMETREKLIAQSQYTTNFYKNFFSLAFTHNFRKLKNPSYDLSKDFPLRILPLFGVHIEKYGKSKSGDKIPLLENVEVNLEKNALYLSRNNSEEKNETYNLLNNTDLYEQSQSNYLKRISAANLNTFKNKVGAVSNEERELIAKILRGLGNDDKLTQSKALILLNTYTNAYSDQFQFDVNVNYNYKANSSALSSLTRLYLNTLRNLIGNPYPILTPGMAYAHTVSTDDTFIDDEKNAKFILKNNQYQFNNATILTLYNMLCNKNYLTFSENYSEGINFQAPSVLKDNSQIEICNLIGLKNSWLRDHKNSNQQIFTSQDLFNYKINGVSIIDYLLNYENLNSKLTEDLNNSDNKLKKFNEYWENQMKLQDLSFSGFDDRLGTYVKATQNNFIENRDYTDFAADYVSDGPFNMFKSNYLSTNIRDTFKTEINFMFDLIFKLNTKKQDPQFENWFKNLRANSENLERVDEADQVFKNIKNNFFKTYFNSDFASYIEANEQVKSLLDENNVKLLEIAKEKNDINEIAAIYYKETRTFVKLISLIQIKYVQVQIDIESKKSSDKQLLKLLNETKSSLLKNVITLKQYSSIFLLNSLFDSIDLFLKEKVTPDDIKNTESNFKEIFTTVVQLNDEQIESALNSKNFALRLQAQILKNLKLIQEETKKYALLKLTFKDYQKMQRDELAKIKDLCKNLFNTNPTKAATKY